MKRYARKRKLLCVVLIVLAILLFYPFTIFFRGVMVPWYANTFYRHSVYKAYHDAFDNLNGQLASLGFVTTLKPASCYNRVSDNGNAWFHYASETVPCMQESTTQPLTLTAAFKGRWARLAPSIEAALLADGWIEGGNFESSAKLPDLYESDYYDAPQTAYAKTSGKFECDLLFEYANDTGQPASESNTKGEVWESCTRNVSFFGGYID